jgi:hypothetical protein
MGAIPDDARDALEVCGVAALLRDDTRTERLEVRLLEDVEHSTRILMVVDEDADSGRYAYHDLIAALHDAGMSVYAKNDSGSEYDAGWELRAAGGQVTERSMSEVFGITLVSGGELLDACRHAAPGAKTLEYVPAAALRSAVLELFVEPDLSRAVLEAS